MSVYFFGCIREVGHHMWSDEQTRVRPWDCMAIFGNEWSLIDSAPHTESSWLLQRKDYGGTWTVLSSQDRTVDPRPGSHATFLIKGVWEREDAVRFAREKFPNVCARVGLA